MTDQEAVRLVIQGDDFGMCHAVNVGTVRAFTEGVLTQSSAMVPCPWFDEAAALAQAHGIPLGIHQTLTCEWDHLRWRPLTGAASLMGDDWTFHRTVAAARDAADHDEAVAELVAQTERFLSTGNALTYYDVHMGVVAPRAYTEVTKRFSRPFLYPGLDTSLTFTSIKGLSERDAATKKEWLLGWFERLTPGVHLLVCHLAEPGEEISSITTPESSPWLWAEEYRKSDLAVLTDRDVRAAIDKLGIELTSVSREFATTSS